MESLDSWDFQARDCVKAKERERESERVQINVENCSKS